MRKVPFNFNVREHPDKKDARLGEKLQAEASGILNWLVAGCLSWQRIGLDAPAFVIAATDAMRASQDGLRMFLVDRCKRDPEGIAPAKDMYLAYKAWTDEAGERGALTQTIFGRMLRERGFYSFKSGGNIKYRGLYLIEPAEVTEETVDSWDDTPKLSTVENPEFIRADTIGVDSVDSFPGLVSREATIEKTPGNSPYYPHYPHPDAQPEAPSEEASPLICPACGGSDIRRYGGDLRCYHCDEKLLQRPQREN